MSTQRPSTTRCAKRTTWAGECAALRASRPLRRAASEHPHTDGWLRRYADTDTQWRLKDMVSAPLTRSLQAVAQQVIDAKQNVQAKVPQMRPVLPNTVDSDTNTCVNRLRQSCCMRRQWHPRWRTIDTVVTTMGAG